MALELDLWPGRYAVARLSPDTEPPADLWTGPGLVSVTRTPAELSIVCPAERVPPGAVVENDWRLLTVRGPLDFALTGILADLAGTLAQAKVPLFAVSSYDTDHLLVRTGDVDRAVAALHAAGHTVHGPCDRPPVALHRSTRSRMLTIVGVAREERRRLCDLFEELGPDAPTLCEGWRTRDLAAHLVLRERRFDAVPGIGVRALAGYTRRVQDRIAARPWTQLVDQVRQGPPRWSPYAIGRVDDLVNTAEFFVHHEDVRRAQPEWQPRPADPVRDAALWRTVGLIGRVAFRRSPVGVALRRPDGQEIVVRRGPRTVTLVGESGELLLYAFGREAVTLDFKGADSDVAVVRSLRRGF